jgi:hypothetical protein
VIGREVVELLWNVADTADPHLDRQLIAYLQVLPLSHDEARELIADLLSVFERLGEERPDVLLPFLGRLLNEAQAGET